MSKLTKQGLRGSLYCALEFGFKQCESGHNLEHARYAAADMFEKLVESCENLPTEVMRINFRAPKGKKVSIVEREATK